VKKNTKASAQKIARPAPYTTQVLLLGWAAPWPPGIRRVADLPPVEAAEVAALQRELDTAAATTALS